MDILTIEKLKSLINKGNEICLSIYLPTYIAGKEVEQNHIRYKNLVRQAEEKLHENGLRPNEVEQLLKPVRAYIDDKLFWKYQSQGLAVFRSADEFQAFRLPLEFSELVVVANRFHVKPVLPLFSSDGQYYILAFSMNRVRFFQGTRHSVSELALEGVPKSLSDALKYEFTERELQFHTGAPRHGGKRDAQFFGTAASEPDTKDNLLRYFQQLDKGVREFLKEEKAPLVLAGVDYLLPIYKEANKYPHLVSEGLHGNPDSIAAKDLHEKSWQLVAPKFYESQSKDSDRLKQLLGTDNKLASLEIEEIITAAFSKRVETLFVATGVQIWGKFDDKDLSIAIHEEQEEGDDDLLDLTSVFTLVNGGTVYPTPHKKMFRQKPIAAIFRY
jgi:hypothetical protein